MIKRITDRVTINQNIGMSHPYWYSIGKQRHYDKLLAFIEKHPETATRLPPLFFSAFPAVFNLYIDTVRFRLERHEWNLTQLMEIPEEIGGGALMKISEEKALQLARAATGTIVDKVLEKGEEQVIGTSRSQPICMYAGSYDDLLENGSGRHREAVYQVLVEDIVKTPVKLKREWHFRAERDYLSILKDRFPDRPALFKKMLAELPADKCDIIDTFSFDTRTRTEEIRETT